jgi:uncharacterized membrane protein
VKVITHPKHALNMADWDRGISLAAGGLLAVSALTKGWAGIPRALMGAELLRRGLTGHCLLYEFFGVRTAPLGQGAATTSVPYELGLRVDRAVTISRQRPEVYRFFRNLGNLPQFMRRVQSVQEIDSNRSHWIVKGPAGRTVEWDAVVHNERENELIAWRTLPGADVDHAGSVLFRDAPYGRGTEVKVELQYNPPAGAAGAILAALWGEEPTRQIEDDLRRLKQILEVGEVLFTEGQPRGVEAGGSRPNRFRRTPRPRTESMVELASEASFPASDAPSYTR